MTANKCETSKEKLAGIEKYNTLDRMQRIKDNLDKEGILPMKDEVVSLRSFNVDGIEYKKAQIHCSTIDEEGIFRDGILLYLTGENNKKDSYTIILFFLPNRSDFLEENGIGEDEVDDTSEDHYGKYKPGELYCIRKKIVITTSNGDIVNINYYNRKGGVAKE